MNKIYPSKISIALILPIIVVIFSSLLAFMLNRQWIILLLFLPVIAFVIHLLLTTHYQIIDDILIVKSGLLTNRKIDIHHIRKVVQTTNPMSSPALSLDRIEVFYDKFDSIIISPKEKITFIDDLRQINPAIEVNLNSNSAGKTG